MNKKNSVIIAVVLLLLLGTGSFVFAGSPEEKKETNNNNQTTNKNTEGNKNNTNQNNKDKEEIDPPSIPTFDEEEDDLGTGTLSPSENTTNSVQINRPSGGNNQNNNSNGNTGNPIIPTPPVIPTEPTQPEEPENNVTKEEVLDAITKAETTLNPDDIQNALDLLDKLKDSEEKEELENRLEILQKEANLTKLLEKIKAEIKEAKSKTDLQNIYINNEVSTLNEQINKLPENFTKTVLLETLKEILEILEDNTAPKIEGINPNEITNQAVTITIDDKNATIWLDDKIISIEELNQLTQNKENRTYEIKVVDSAFNESSLSFTIDTIAPTAVVEYDKDLQIKTNQPITAKLVEQSEEIIITNNENKDFYTFNENGKFTFEFEDAAGNIGTAKAEVNNIDNKAPEYKKLGILNFSRIGTEKKLDTANLNDMVKIYVTFSEKLKNVPTIKINDIELVTILDEVNSTEDNVVYSANYQIEETTLEGFANISITNILDEAGNLGKDLTTSDINVEEHNRMYIVIEPGFELIDGGYFNNKIITIKHPDFAYMTIQKAFQDEIRVDTNTYEIPEKGSYTIVIYNAAGEVIESAEMVYDDSNPRIKAKGYNASGTETIRENNTETKDYTKVTLEVTDNALKLVQRVDEAGNVLEVYQEFNPVRPNKRVKLEITNDGNYIIEAIDGSNNKTTIRFNIKTT